MTDVEAVKLEIDAWERRRQRIKGYYMSQGMSKNAADEKATADVCREIQASHKTAK